MSDDALLRFPCPGCGRKLKAKPELTGKQCQCPHCSTILTIPQSIPKVPPSAKPATEKQKQFARELGIAFDVSVSSKELGALIGKARKERDERRAAERGHLPATDKQLAYANELGIVVPGTVSRSAISAMIDSRLVEIEAEDAEASNAEYAAELAADFVNDVKGCERFAIAIVWKDESSCTMHYSDNVTLENANAMIKKYGLQLLVSEGTIRPDP